MLKTAMDPVHAARGTRAELCSGGSIDLAGVVLEATRLDARERNEHALGAVPPVSPSLGSGG